jgi:hypothetical protein
MKKRINIKRKLSSPLRRPPRLEGKVHKFGIKPIRKKSKKGRKVN